MGLIIFSILLKILLNSSQIEMCATNQLNASGPIPSWQIDGKTVETVSDFLFWGSKTTADGFKRCMKLKDTYSLEGKL